VKRVIVPPIARVLAVPLGWAGFRCRGNVVAVFGDSRIGSYRNSGPPVLGYGFLFWHGNRAGVELQMGCVMTAHKVARVGGLPACVVGDCDLSLPCRGGTGH